MLCTHMVETLNPIACGGGFLGDATAHLLRTGRGGRHEVNCVLSRKAQEAAGAKALRCKGACTPFRETEHRAEWGSAEGPGRQAQVLTQFESDSFLGAPGALN